MTTRDVARTMMKTPMSDHSRRDEAMSEPVSPAFMFGRRRDIELETGLILAGTLVVDLPKNAKVKRRHERRISEMVQQLVEAARSGQMQGKYVVFGWRDGRRPDNADAFVNS